MRVFGAAAALLAGICLGLCAAAPARAEGERAGDFDYYVLSLSWSPTWCAGEGAGRGAAQCARGAGFVVHGLWPQFEAGWPSWCRTPARDPSRAQSAAMEDLMGSDGAAWHQWKKHGRCSGRPAAEYYAQIRAAAARVRIPEVFARLPRDVTLPPAVVEEAFLEANPAMTPQGVTVTCAQGRIDEVRICLTRDLAPRDCAADAARDCRAGAARMEAPR